MDINQITAYVTDYKYLQSLLIFVFFFIISKLVVYISEKHILKITAKTKTEVDDLIIKKINKPISFILLFVGIRLALVPLPVAEKALGHINHAVSSLVIIAVGYIVFDILNILLNSWSTTFAKKTKSEIDDNIVSLLNKVSRIVVGLLVLLFILDVWGVKVGPLLASLGIAGLAVAFALQPTLSNIFGGISMILDKTIKIGDVIKLDGGEGGKVHDIGIRSTKIKTWDNEIITIPNGKLVDTQIKNKTLPDPSIRINIEFGVEYGSDVDQVKKLALETVKKIPEVLKDPEPQIWFTQMGDFALNFKIMFWVDELSKKWPTHQKAITELYNNLNKAQIGIPFPTRTVYLHK
ncbi:hypothetical protein CEE44_04040 [Candidatus Woesearchaeota archaeon B3_Woes]|nr:MAG: hypothetical protein CEE44_04040 [Candidatus Woesearchaeota archaeon B3_Woes]